MNTTFDPLISEFDSSDDAEKYDLWFRAKVRKSLADPRPSIPHDEAMARIRAELKKRIAERANG
ncbi:hypothetical protein GCM10023206_26440 [Acinetobacter puyangensis]|uniref:Stability determinant domain-containing protein n=1 Tax=Acinetobacter puyangensis TaxID=1096779 RepID=A0A240E4T1_9GAMM|nr:antitoxin [Acinetobacter puyangensis]SNX43586.1 hypothetical protein SAMN05421731_101628 [Acinetobacter puyangensis]